jgi:hypothetical protein
MAPVIRLRWPTVPVTSPVAVIVLKVTLLVVAIDCGRLRVTAPVLALAVTWLDVPVMEDTLEDHVVS